MDGLDINHAYPKTSQWGPKMLQNLHNQHMPPLVHLQVAISKELAILQGKLIYNNTFEAMR